MKGGVNKVNERVFLYLRLASTIQTSATTLDHQEAACRTFCEQHGLPVVEVFREVGSGLCWQGHKALAQMR